MGHNLIINQDFFPQKKESRLESCFHQKVSPGICPWLGARRGQRDPGWMKKSWTDRVMGPSLERGAYKCPPPPSPPRIYKVEYSLFNQIFTAPFILSKKIPMQKENVFILRVDITMSFFKIVSLCQFASVL